MLRCLEQGLAHSRHSVNASHYIIYYSPISGHDDALVTTPNASSFILWVPEMKQRPRIEGGFFSQSSHMAGRKLLFSTVFLQSLNMGDAV